MTTRKIYTAALSKKRKVYLQLCLGLLLCFLILPLVYGFIISRFTSTIRSIAPANASFAISPDEKSIVFVGQSGGQDKLYTLSLATLHVARLTNAPGIETEPAFSPDGKYIVYTYANKAKETSHIFMCTSFGTVGKQITFGVGIADATPSFSNDGTNIVFARASWHRPYSMGGTTWDNWDIYVVNVNGNSLRKLTDDNYYNIYPPKFSLDNQYILYAASPHSANSLGTDIFLVSVAGNQMPVSLTVSHNNYWPSYSRDGKSILFVSDQEEQYKMDLFSMDLSGHHMTPLHVTKTSAYNQQPLYTPDGEHIFFLGDPKPEEGIKFNLYQVDRTGNHIGEIADDTLFSNPLQWRSKLHLGLNP